MAKVFQRPEMRNAAGKPAWCILYKGLDKKWHRERTDALTKEQAQKILQQRLSKQSDAEGKGLTSLDHLAPVTFETFFRDTYLALSEVRNRPSTKRRKKGIGARHLLPFFGPKTLRSITAGMVEEYRIMRSKAVPAPAPATINRETAVLSNVMNAAFRSGKVDENPVERTLPLKEDNCKDRWLTEREVEEILDHAEEWVKPFIVLAVQTGMRRGELTSLTWDRVDLDMGFIKLDQKRSKNHKSRAIPINSVAREVLEEALKRRLKAKGGPATHVLFNQRRGKPYGGDSVGHSFTEAVAAAEKARMERSAGDGTHENPPPLSDHPSRNQAPTPSGLAGVTFHSCRHTFCSWLIQAGVPIAEVQGHLGHGSDSMTRRYAHLAPQVARSGALEVLAARQGRGSSQSLPTPSQPEIAQGLRKTLVPKVRSV